jgi:hypothetical protein
MKKKILIGILVLFVLAQAVQPTKNNGTGTNPNDITTLHDVPENVMGILKKSCYDCHSNYTNYPWYDHITPVNWWVANHIKEGKRELNFNEFASYSSEKQLKKLKEMAEEVEEEEMPLPSYLFTHGDARLNIDQKKLLIDWAKNISGERGERE